MRNCYGIGESKYSKTILLYACLPRCVLILCFVNLQLHLIFIGDQMMLLSILRITIQEPQMLVRHIGEYEDYNEQYPININCSGIVQHG